MSRFNYPGLVVAIVSAIAVPADAHAAEAPIEAPVVGGSRVPAGKWRDVVVVVARDSTCTGTLVAPDVVLTAGHCIEAGPIEVITDTIDYGLPGGGGDRIPVKWARAYPDWPNRYDIGVIMLEHVARGRARKIASTCHTRELLVPGGLVHVVGFGMATATGDDGNTAMREADVPVLDPTCTMDLACESSIAPHGEFMAGGRGTDSCFGDSGGPAYLDTPEGPALVGVVSRGLALPGAPCGNGGVYVRADKVVSWIQSVTRTRLARTTCEGRADGDTAVEPEGGCAAGSGAGLGAVLAALALRRRRRST
jgi:secreted trypsin-like serine protease